MRTPLYYPKGSSKVQGKERQKYEFGANMIITKKFTESTLMQKTFLKTYLTNFIVLCKGFN